MLCFYLAEEAERIYCDTYGAFAHSACAGIEWMCSNGESGTDSESKRSSSDAEDDGCKDKEDVSDAAGNDDENAVGSDDVEADFKPQLLLTQTNIQQIPQRDPAIQRRSAPRIS